MTVHTSEYGSPPLAVGGGETTHAASLSHDEPLSRSEERYRSLVLATSSIVWSTNTEGEIVEECPTWTAFTGQPFEKYRGLGWIEAVHPDDRHHTRHAWSEAVRLGRLYEVEYRLRHRDGEWRHVLARGAPVRDASGTIREWVGTCSDISDRVRVEDALREEVRINDILHHVGMSLAAELDLQKLIQQVTDAATGAIRAKYGAFFYTVNEQDGGRFTLFCLSGAPREVFEKYPTPRATEIFGPTFRGEGISRMDDVTKDPGFGRNPPFNGLPPGHPPVKSFLSVPVITRSKEVIGGLFFGHPDAGVFTARDERIVRGIASQAAIAIENATLVRDIRQTQEQLRRSKEELEVLVDERTHELQIANQQLRVSNRELEDFASVASHDLQEPLRKIQAFGDRLEAKSGPNLGPEGQDYLHRMRNAAGRMQTLISDLLQFSRVTTRAQPFVPTDLNQIAHDVLIDLETRLEQTGGKVDVAPLPTIDADPMQMRQLLQNLIGNALKFRKPGEQPVVKIHSETDDTEGVFRLYVEDNGIGFDEKYLDRIFNVFQRLHSRGTYEGTGIGLAVCRKIAERHGGSITARSTPDVGSTFVVTLPAKHFEPREPNA